METATRAFAKINLHLEILNKRDDGYHNILGLFANIGLFDLLKLDEINIINDPAKIPDVSINITGGDYKEHIKHISADENLIAKASKLYLKKINKSGRISFSLIKNIPAGGGLGGGSADSAAALRLLSDNIIRLNETELAKIGKETGADVPFCLAGGYGLCEGIGEKIEKISGKLNYYILLVNNGIQIETAAAYGLLKRGSDYNRKISENTRSLLKQFISKGNILNVKNVLKNDFEEKVFDLYPELGIIKNRLYGSGAVFALLSGSGSTLFGLFDDFEKASSALNLLKKEYKMVLLTNFL